MYSQFKGVDHIDPLKSKLICGLDILKNVVQSNLEYNKAKSNAFVPYRVCSMEAPRIFGDMSEFLINGEWIICPFGGNQWWEEVKRLGYSRTNTRKTFWVHDPISGKEKMVKEGEIPAGFIKGRNKSVLNSEALKKAKGAIRGLKAFYRKDTHELRYFKANPDQSLWENGLPPQIRQRMSDSGRKKILKKKREGILVRQDLYNDITNIINLYNKGMSTSHLAKLFVTNHRTISLLLKRYGVELRRKAANKAERDLSKKLYNDAISQTHPRNPWS
jgi:hypothetical protein